MLKQAQRYFFAVIIILLNFNSLSCSGSNGFDELPQEIMLSHVCPYIDEKGLVALGQTAHRFQKLVLEVPCEEEIFIIRQSVLNQCINSPSAQKRIRKLKLSNQLDKGTQYKSFKIDAELYESLNKDWEKLLKEKDLIIDLSNLNQLEGLRQLKIEDCFPNRVIKTLTLPIQLQELKIQCDYSGGEALKDITLPSTLQALTLYTADFQGVEETNPFTMSLPLLKHFYLKAPRSLPPSKIRKRVTCLKLPINREETMSLSHIVSFSNLEELLINGTFPEEFLVQLEFPAHLKVLYMSCYYLSSQALANLKFPSDLETLILRDADLTFIKDCSPFSSLKSFKLITPKTLPRGGLRSKVTDLVFEYHDMSVISSFDLSSLELFDNLISLKIADYIVDEIFETINVPLSLKSLTMNCAYLSAEGLRDWPIPASLTHLTLDYPDLGLLDKNSLFILSLSNSNLISLKIEARASLNEEINFSNYVKSVYLGNADLFELKNL